MTRAALAALLIALTAALLPGRGLADGRVSMAVGADRVEGEVLGFDGTYLRLQTAAGEVTLRYDPALCTGACPQPEDFLPELRFSGTRRLGTLVLPALIEAYGRETGLPVARIDGPEDGYRYDLGEAARPALTLTVRITTTADGLADLLAGEADLALAARYPVTAEQALADAAGLAWSSRLIAVEPLLPVTAPTLPVRVLDLGQLAALMSGEVLDWAAFGAPPQVARLHVGADDDETPAVIAALATGLVAADRPVVRHDEGAALSDAIAADPGGFGLLPPSEVGLTHALRLRGACGLELRPEPGLVAAGDYPLALPLLLVQPRRRVPPVAADFLDWLDSAAAQGVLRRAGVAGMAEQEIPVAGQGERFVAAMLSAGADQGELQRLARFVRDKTRLSPTFRFDGETLDPVSRGRLRALAATLADRDDPLWLVGFSAVEASADPADERSRERAEAVRDALAESLGGALPEGLALRIAEFGASLPVACGESPLARSLNDRVELWTLAD